MRNFIFALAALFFIFETDAKAASLQTLFVNCSIWADNDFSTEFSSDDLDTVEPVKVAGCLFYLSAWRDGAKFNCYLRANRQPEMENAAFGFFNNLSIEQLAQMIINFAKEHPELWDENPSYMTPAIAPSGKCE